MNQSTAARDAGGRYRLFAGFCPAMVTDSSNGYFPRRTAGAARPRAGRPHPLLKNEAGQITGLEFFNRDGWLMTNCDLVLFRKLKPKKAIKSSGGRPYRITRRGLELVRSEYDNR